VNVRVPVTEPAAAGVKVTPMAQLLLAATVVPQVFEEIANPVVTAMLLKFTADVRWLVSVTVLAELVEPIVTVPKLRLPDESVMGAVPVPDKLTL
jgi:hypothetical protein